MLVCFLFFHYLSPSLSLPLSDFTEIYVCVSCYLRYAVRVTSFDHILLSYHLLNAFCYRDGTCLVSASEDGTARVFDLRFMQS